MRYFVGVAGAGVVAGVDLVMSYLITCAVQVEETVLLSVYVSFPTTISYFASAPATV